MNKIKTLKRFGIADCYGIESYLDVKEKEKTLNYMVMRARANRQRHAVVYEVEVTEEVNKKVQKLLRVKNWAMALVALKENALVVSVAKGAGMEKSWGMIPNPELDPYGD